MTGRGLVGDAEVVDLPLQLTRMLIDGRAFVLSGAEPAPEPHVLKQQRSGRDQRQHRCHREGRDEPRCDRNAAIRRGLARRSIDGTDEPAS